ncbi:hypothetical protein FB446DRAFT_737902, partial [Lentinula raphanica]
MAPKFSLLFLCLRCMSASFSDRRWKFPQILNVNSAILAKADAIDSERYAFFPKLILDSESPGKMSNDVGGC